MIVERFTALAKRYADLRVMVVGDLCLDRYMEIDPARTETSIETGLPVHNVLNVRAQPGGAGTVVANLVALGVGRIDVVSYCGDDGEGYELRRALSQMPGVCMDAFFCAADRRTFTYCKPLLLEGDGPRELSRLDSKNWSPTPPELSHRLAEAVATLGVHADGLIAVEQTDVPGTGVMTETVCAALGALASARLAVPMLADSRRGLGAFPPLNFKMNDAELAVLMGASSLPNQEAVRAAAVEWARRHGRSTFVTLAEEGIVAAEPDGSVCHVPSLPLRGPIDIVGAGDSVTANVTVALAAGATTLEACRIAMAAASHTVHQVGTTGAASTLDICALL